MPKLPSILAGVAGEYFVAGELSRRGHISSITLRNTKGVDILVSNQDVTRQIGIQVKTNQNNKREWVLSEKAEDYFAENLFYVFVNLRDENQRSEYFIVPSFVVAEYTKNSHREWLKTPGKKGQKHNDSSVRMFRDLEGEFLEKWGLLNL